MITLNGVMQAPGGPGENTSDGFNFGGWVAPYSDEVHGKVVEKELKPADYLLGRKTFEIWENYWPAHADFCPGIAVYSTWNVGPQEKSALGERARSRTWRTGD